MRILTITVFWFHELNVGAQERAIGLLEDDDMSFKNTMQFFADGTLCPVKEGPCFSEDRSIQASS
jgi:hypothetical protein